MVCQRLWAAPALNVSIHPEAGNSAGCRLREAVGLDFHRGEYFCYQFHKFARQRRHIFHFCSLADSANSAVSLASRGTKVLSGRRPDVLKVSVYTAGLCWPPPPDIAGGISPRRKRFATVGEPCLKKNLLELMAADGASSRGIFVPDKHRL